MTKTLQNVTLVATTLAAGLTAGLFAGFGYAVMPGLRGTDDKAFVDAVQRINVSIVNPLFMTIFMGGLLLAIAAVIVHWRGEQRAALPWIIAGAVLYLVMFMVTSGVNVPLNDELADAGDPDRIANLAAVREQFEDKWVVWNIVRAVANTAAFGCLIWACVLHGRKGAPQAAAPAPMANQAYAGYSFDGRNR